MLKYILLYNMFRILYSAYKKTNNIYTSIVGKKLKENIFYNSNSELNKTNWSIVKFIHFLSDIFLIKLPIHCPSWIPYPIKKLFFGENSTYLPANIEYEDGICIIFINFVK